jgi:hypothetical protein
LDTWRAQGHCSARAKAKREVEEKDMITEQDSNEVGDFIAKHLLEPGAFITIRAMKTRLAPDWKARVSVSMGHNGIQEKYAQGHTLLEALKNTASK